LELPAQAEPCRWLRVGLPLRAEKRLAPAELSSCTWGSALANSQPGSVRV